MNDGDRRDDDTRPLGDELFEAPRTEGPTSDVHPTVPLTTEPPAAEPARDGDTTVLDVPGPADHERPAVASTGSAPGPATGATGPAAGPSAGGSSAPTGPWVPGEQTPPVRRGPRVSTIVWGFVIVAFGVVVLAAALGARVDLGLATIVVLAAAGITLVVGSVVSGARRRRG